MHRSVHCATLGGARLSVTYANICSALLEYQLVSISLQQHIPSPTHQYQNSAHIHADTDIENVGTNANIISVLVQPYCVCLYYMLNLSVIYRMNCDDTIPE